jgi:hypothetical protein
MIHGPCGSPSCWRLGEWDRANRTAPVVHFFLIFKFPTRKRHQNTFENVQWHRYRPIVDCMREECNTHMFSNSAGPTCCRLFEVVPYPGRYSKAWGSGTIWPASGIGPIAPRPIDAQFALLSLISPKKCPPCQFSEMFCFLLGLHVATVN